MVWPMKDKSYQWMVKLHGELKGPFSQDEVLRLLRDGVLSVDDDAIQPCGQWQCIRDYKELQLRDHDSSSPALPKLNNEGVSDLQPPDEQVTEPQTLSSPASLTPPVASQPVASQPVASQPASTAEPASAPSSHSTLWLLKLSVVFLVCVVGAGLISWWQHYHHSNSVASFKKRAFLYLAAGNTEHATQMLQDLHNQNPADTSLYLHLGLLLQKSGKKEEGLQLLNKLRIIESAATSPETRLALGLTDLRAGRYQQAEEKFLQLQPSSDSLYLDAQINYAFVYFLQNKFQQAADIWARAADKRPMAHLMQAYAMSKAPIVSSRELEKLAVELKNASVFYYRQEMMFLSLYLQHRLHQKLDVELLTYALNLDPYQTQQHAPSLFVYTGLNWWKSFLPLCRMMSNQSDVHSLVTQAFCLAQAQAFKPALKNLQRALVQRPKSSQALALKAYVLERSGQKSQAVQPAQQAVQHNSAKHLLPMLMQAYLCRKSSCAQLWENIRRQDPQQLAALAYLSRTNKSYLLQGLKLSENYKPFLDLVFIK